jgi:hypothetical protein
MSYAVPKDWRGHFVYNARMMAALGDSRGLRRLWRRLRFRWEYGPVPR